MSLLKSQLFPDETFKDLTEKTVRCYHYLPQSSQDWLWQNYNTPIPTQDMLEGMLIALCGLEISLPGPGENVILDIMRTLIVDSASPCVLALAHRTGLIDLEPLKSCAALKKETPNG